MKQAPGAHHPVHPFFLASCAAEALNLPPSSLNVFVHSQDHHSMRIDVSKVVQASETAGGDALFVDSFLHVEPHVASTHRDAGALLVAVYMRPSRELDLLARGLLPLVAREAASESAVFVRQSTWLKLTSSNIGRPDVILHKSTDDLATGGSACGGQDEWPAFARSLAAFAETNAPLAFAPSNKTKHTQTPSSCYPFPPYHNL